MPRTSPDPNPISELATIDGNGQDNNPDRSNSADCAASPFVCRTPDERNFGDYGAKS
jgi:hypothetical protein